MATRVQNVQNGQNNATFRLSPLCSYHTTTRVVAIFGLVMLGIANLLRVACFIFSVFLGPFYST